MLGTLCQNVNTFNLPVQNLSYYGFHFTHCKVLANTISEIIIIFIKKGNEIIIIKLLFATALFDFFRNEFGKFA